ncbi:benzoate-CoA ligase family protein [Lacisediminimonas profundi]|uniref:benzoate-CoA ligase family protein n=1 Tax=Lacisediminimonas profundi TaxID=2603856 RepID=UPI001386D2B8|nr:benzoate-CoA ligase family protein [Lacisediminimonas profundi]
MNAVMQEKRPAPGLEGNVVDYLFEHRMAPAEAQRPYLITPSGNFSFGDLYRRTCQVGQMLKAQGVQPGDRVMFSLLDGLDFVATFLGAMKIGAISLPLNTFLKAADYAYYIRDSGVRAVIVDHSLVGRIDEIRHAGDFPKLLFVANGAAEGYRAFEPEVDRMPQALDTFPRRPDEAAFWLYSSGSTGAPKGVVHTHDHIYWATELFGLGTVGMDASDVIQCPPKMFFAYGLGNQVYFPLRTGAAIVVESGPIKPQAVLDKLIAHRPTLMMSVPTLYAGVLDLMRGMDPDAVRQACSRLRCCISGGELLPPALNRQWLAMTGKEIMDGVGTTELTHMFMINLPGQIVPGSCGKLVKGYEAYCLDEEGKRLPLGEIGNLFVKGPTAAQIYWNKPEKTAATMWDGGVLTGDKCYQDAEGNFFYVGRMDDMLRVGGIWVSPGEIESVLAEHAAILECAVIGAADEHDMIKPKAFVVLRPGVQADEPLRDSIRELLRSKLAHIKCPRWIEFVPDLPKTATGKIQRFRLRSGDTAGQPA